MQTRAGQRDEVGGEFFSYKYDSVVIKWKNKHERTVELFVILVNTVQRLKTGRPL